MRTSDRFLLSPPPLSLRLAWRALGSDRARTALSTLAVALGATMTIAGDVVGGAIVNALSRNEDVIAVAGGVFNQLDPLLKSVGAVIMLAAGFLIFNTFGMSVTQRRQQLGALRALGMTRRQVLDLVLVEALLIGGAGVALGVALGPPFGSGLIALLKAAGPPGLTAFEARGASPLSFGLAVLLGLGVTLLAALVPARQAARLSPLTALRAEDLPGAPPGSRRLAYAGLGLLGPILALCLLLPPALWNKPPFDLPLTLGLAALWLAGVGLALPGAIEAWARRLAGPLARRWGAAGRLMADNLLRARQRALLTALSLAVGLTLITGISGFFRVYSVEIFGPSMRAARDTGGWMITPFDVRGGTAAYASLDSLRLKPGLLQAAEAMAAGRGEVQGAYFIIVPELSYFYDNFMSFVLDPRVVQQSGSFYFTFTEGDWETAMPRMQSGCGVLVAPGVASKNNAGLGDVITVTGLNGPVECVIAGIGQPFVGASIVGEAAREQFILGEPFGLIVFPMAGADRAQLGADVQAFAGQNGLSFLELQDMVKLQLQLFEGVPFMLNGFLLLAILASALGVVNTTLLSVTERRRELGQVRALGATRAQVRAIVVGEAALTGAVGGAAGLLAGAGLVTIFATVYGGASMGVASYQPLKAAWTGLQPALLVGALGLLVAPLVCGLAAYFPANSVLRGAAIETLKPEIIPAESLNRQITGLLSRGSLQARFTLGTGLLLLGVLAALIQTVSAHTAGFLEAQTRDTLRSVAAWNAASLELALPREAQNLDLQDLQAGQADADMLLRFRSLMNRLGENGLVDYAVTDRDNVVLFGLDANQAGQVRPPLPSQTQVVVERLEAESGPQLRASAPLRAAGNGEVIGSVRITVALTRAAGILDTIRRTLWLAGGAVTLAGALLAWLLGRPVTRAAEALARQAGRTRQGDYTAVPVRVPLNLSIRARLTVLMSLAVLILVGVMSLLVAPIQQREVERSLKDGLLVTAEWLAEAMSDGLGQAALPANVTDLARLMGQLGSADPARVQALVEQSRGDMIAYMALVDTGGKITASDQLALVGEPGLAVDAPQVADGEWRGQRIWIVAAPVRQGAQGEIAGALNVGARPDQLDAYLAESRSIFRFLGLSAVLAGVLLAQALGGAAAAPLEQLARDTRRVAEGDLSVRFRGGAPGPRPGQVRDEVAQLGLAFNAMVAGLRERERLRDLFGKYVGPEVREAIESGRVTLQGERRLITCLYVDMRGSTAFAERYPPEQVMQALNEYFQVVVLAVEAHGGIISRFVGDEAVCVFGAPAEAPEHARQALDAALAIRAGLAYLNQRRQAAGQPALTFSMGLNTGEVIAGATGTEERQEYTLIGDAMNVGARIQALTRNFPEHDLLLSEFTVASLGQAAAAYLLVDLGQAEIRGKSQPVRVYGVK